MPKLTDKQNFGDTLVKLLDSSCLDENTRNSMYIAWLSCTDFGRLKESNNRAILNKTWKNLKNSLYPYFRDQPISLDAIAGDFKKITLTLNPTISFGYDPKRNILIYQLWNFLFDLCADNRECFAVPAFPPKLAAELVHEHDHYLFLKDHDMIGKDKDEKCEAETEKCAFAAQIAFLEKCKSNTPPSFIFEQIKVTAWTTDGQPTLHPNCTIDLLSRAKIIAQINDQIQVQSQAAKEIDDGNYSKSSYSIDVSQCVDIVKMLTLPTRVNTKKETYPEITIDL